jgi:hypothetical protein
MEIFPLPATLADFESELPEAPFESFAFAAFSA